MKKIKNFYSFVNELKTHDYSESNEKYFILYKGNLFIYDEDNWEEAAKKFSMEDSEDVYDFNQNLSEESPYILMGQFSDDTIYLEYSPYRHSKTSDELKKVSKELGIDNIKYIHRTDMMDEHELDVSLEDFKSAIYYHGTCYKHLNNIRKFGLMPNKETNFKNIFHSDKVFLTTNKEKAFFHAETCANKNQSFPIILELKVPDINRLLPDFDLAVQFYGSDSEEFIQNYKGNYDIGDFLDKSVVYQNIEDKLMDFTKRLGIYAYKGRIPSSHITNVILDIDMFDEFLTRELYGEEFELDMDRFDSIQDWTKYTFSELKDYEDEHEESLLNIE